MPTKTTRTKRSKRSKPAKKSRGRRHTPVERAKILAAAQREGLSGPAAAKRFGISTLTFYNWRKAGRPGRPRTAKPAVRLRTGVAGQLRMQIRKTLRAMVPNILREEVQSAVREFIGTRSRRRR